MSCDFSILIPTHNRSSVLKNTLDSIGRLDRLVGKDIEVVVIANACTDNTEAVVQEMANGFPYPLRCIAEPVAGLNVARNRCAIEAQGSIYAYLDDDVKLDSGWLIALNEAFEVHHADIVGGRVWLWWDQIERPAWMSDEVTGLLSRNDHGDKVLEVHDTSVAIGANMAFRREVYEAVDGFRPGLDRTGTQTLSGGESDLIRRALAKGFRAFYSPGALVHHWVAPGRIEQKYLDAVSFGNGASNIFALDRMKLPVLLRRLAGATYHLCVDGMVESAAKLSGNKMASITHRSRRKRSLGVLWGIAIRLLGKHPTRSWN